LFKPATAIRMRPSTFTGTPMPKDEPLAVNPPDGAVIDYALPAAVESAVTLTILDANGNPVRRFSSTELTKPPDPSKLEFAAEWVPPPVRLSTQPGMHRFVWNLRYEEATKFPGLIMWAGDVEGPTAAPGKYTAKLTVAGQSQSQTFTVRPDPRVKTRPEDYAARLALALQIRDKLSAVNRAVVEIREAKKQLARYQKEDKVAGAAKDLDKKLSEIEEALYQTKLKAGEDALNFPIKLNNKLAALKGDVEESDTAPTRQEQMFYEEIATQSNAEIEKLKKLLDGDLPAFNKQVRDANIPAVEVK